MKNIYKDLYRHKKLNIKNNYRVKLMINAIKNLKPVNQKILDIGCFDGTLLSSLPPDNFLYGVEASDFGYKTCLKKGINVTQFFFNDDKFPYKSSSFDIIIAGEIIEHIYDTDQFLNEIYRLLKPNGYLILSTPNIASLPRRIMLLLGMNPIIEISPNRLDSSGHIRYFTFKNLSKLIKENNFNIIKIFSDLINFHPQGKIQSKLVPKILPTIGQSIICLCQKSKK